jgi:hypothetical protein
MPWVQQQTTQKKDALGYRNMTPRPVSCEPSTSTKSLQPETPTFELTNTFFLQRLPLHLEPTALPPELSLNSSSILLGDDDVLFGKHFFDIEKIGRQQPVEAPGSSLFADTASFDTSMEPSQGLLAKEIDEFFEDFDFPDDIGSEIEDDQVFGAFLEQVIS